jgi:hypothetical protein
MATCALLAAAPALAQSGAQALLDDNFVVSLGSFVVSSDITARLDGQTTQNPEIDFDKELGIGRQATRLRLDALWRFAPAHALRTGYFNNSRSATRVLDTAIDWGDHHYAIGAQVDSRWTMDIATLSYEYAFWRRPGHELAASLGVHYSKLALRLSGQATVTDSEGNTTVLPFATRQESVPAPLPVLGLRASWVVAPDWFVEAHAQTLQAKVGDAEGHWSDLRANVTWMFARHWGLGLGYERFYNRVDVSAKNFSGKLKYGYSGLLVNVTAVF